MGIGAMRIGAMRVWGRGEGRLGFARKVEVEVGAGVGVGWDVLPRRRRYGGSHYGAKSVPSLRMRGINNHR